MNLSIDSLVKEILAEHKISKTIILFSILGLFLGQQFFKGWQYTSTTFLIIAVIIAINFIYIVGVAFYGTLKGSYFRYLKYPRSKLDKKFHALLLNGTGYIFEIKNKKYRWIANWQTAQDCGFSEIWTREGRGLEECVLNNVKINTIGGAKIDVNKYSINGGKIITKGIPGS